MELSSAVLLTYVLVFFRMAGFLAFNPIFSHRSLPAAFRVGLMLAMTFFVAPSVGDYTPPATDAAFLWAALCEACIGLGVGFLFQCYYYLLFFAGDVIDQGFGLSMAKAFDPGTNIQASLSARLLQFVFIAYFFSANGHLIFLRIAASSYRFAPLGGTAFWSQAPGFLLSVFVDIFSLVMQLLAPFIVASVTAEAAMGLLMKLIPQINVFMVHFQGKILLGLGLLFLYARPVSNFLLNYQNAMFRQMQNFLEQLA